MTTGERINYRRKELGISAEKLADILGVSPATVYRWENGFIEKLPVSALAPIAKALHTTPAYLMGWEEELKEEYTEEELSETKKRLIEKIKDLDEGTIAALNQIADSIIARRD